MGARAIGSIATIIMEKSIQILLAPNYDLASTVKAEATVEAEYGEKYIEGSLVTLAHHGSRSSNPAPCNTPNVPELPDGSVILVSHLDLDSLGGIQKLLGEQLPDQEFWKAAEYIDVNGPHHIHELSKDIQDKMNAVSAWLEENMQRTRYSEITDVTKDAMEFSKAVNVVLDERHPQHQEYIENGRAWKETSSKETESRLVKEDSNVRMFVTDGVFCCASYYSPKQEKIIPATVVLNTNTDAITVAFADGGKAVSAREIVQKLWGPEAGGHDGIAGSPRGQIMTKEDLQNACTLVKAELMKSKVLSANRQEKVENADKLITIDVKKAIRDAKEISKSNEAKVAGTRSSDMRGERG